MLSRLTHISKFLALTAAALLIAISVHGIFLHKDSHASGPAENHACALCEIGAFPSIFPENPGFVPELTASFISHTYRESRIFIKTPHRLGLRGPPGHVA